MAFHSSQSWQVCLLHHAVTTGGKKPRGPCCGRLHPCVSGLAVPRPSYCCLQDQQPGLGTPGSPVLHRSYWQHCLKSSVSTLYSCHQTARVTRSYLTPAVGHLSLTTCGMTEDTCVRYPAPWKGAVVAMPSCDPEGTWEHSRAGNTWHRNRLMLSQARLLLTQTFLLLLSRARCRRLQDFPGYLRSICEVVCPQLSEASRVTQHGGPLLGPTGTYISSPSPLLFPPLDGRMFTIWNSISSLLCLSLGFWNLTIKNRFCPVPDQLSSGALKGWENVGGGRVSKLMTNTCKGNCHSAPSNSCCFHCFLLLFSTPSFCLLFSGTVSCFLHFPCKELQFETV